MNLLLQVIADLQEALAEGRDAGSEKAEFNVAVVAIEILNTENLRCVCRNLRLQDVYHLQMPSPHRSHLQRSTRRHQRCFFPFHDLPAMTCLFKQACQGGSRFGQRGLPVKPSSSHAARGGFQQGQNLPAKTFLRTQCMWWVLLGHHGKMA